MKISLNEQTIDLLPQGAILLPDQTLVAADVHLGKASAFQARGLAVPEGDSSADLARLTLLVRRHHASRLIINGDLFHSSAGFTLDIEQSIQTWLSNIGVPVLLVVGNHDHKLPRLPQNLESVTSIQVKNFHIVHDPADVENHRPAIAAHWHPVARIADGKRTSLRLPCFLLRDGILVLPSFGSFTGGAIIERKAGDRVFVFPRDQVIEVPSPLLR